MTGLWEVQSMDSGEEHAFSQGDTFENSYLDYYERGICSACG